MDNDYVRKEVMPCVNGTYGKKAWPNFCERGAIKLLFCRPWHNIFGRIEISLCFSQADFIIRHSVLYMTRSDPQTPASNRSTTSLEVALSPSHFRLQTHSPAWQTEPWRQAIFWQGSLTVVLEPVKGGCFRKGRCCEDGRGEGRGSAVLQAG